MRPADFDGLVRNLPEALLVRDKGPLVAKRQPSQDSTRSSDRIALGSALIGGILAAVIVAWRLASSAGPGSAGIDVLGISATNQPAHVQVGAQPQPSSPPTVTPAPTRPPDAAGERAHVANTEGQGVVLRNSPSEDDRMPRGFMDGDSVTVLERSGPDWAHVRGDNGQEGWVPSRYLAPD